MKRALTMLSSMTLGALLSAAQAPKALGSAITVHIGPPSVGTGGSNPVSVPPVNPLEYEIEYVTDGNFEMNFAVTPGLLFGARSVTSAGVYVGFGGGMVLSANGGGPGIYSSFGINTGKVLQFNAEIKQALGYDFNNDTVISPYAFRIGVTVPF